MMEGFAQLSRLTGAQLDTQLEPQTVAPLNAVVRARPYNAQAKPFEGIFALLEQQALSMLPGWIGGNRMRQKIHNVGRARPRLLVEIGKAFTSRLIMHCPNITPVPNPAAVVSRDKAQIRY